MAKVMTRWSGGLKDRAETEAFLAKGSGVETRSVQCHTWSCCIVLVTETSVAVMPRFKRGIK